MSKEKKYDEKLIRSLGKEISRSTDVAKAYAKAKNVEYTETIRKNVSKILCSDKDTDTNQYTTKGVSRLSALKEDGTIMDIREYCDTYKLPFDQVKSYKLVTHSGNGAYYNIASTYVSVESESDFHKDILDSISRMSNRPKTIKRKEKSTESYLLVVDPADVHIGKLADSFEVGEDYNSQIAVKRVREGVEGILQKASGFKIDQILFIGGNDILHVDTPKNTTTAGTFQNTDGMWYRNFLMAKSIYIDVLDRLLEVADVHFVFNPSNHDYMTGFFLADIIQTYYKNCKNITFDCSIAHRKYYTYHKNLIGTSHGDGGKTADLPLTMAHEAKEAWAKTDHKYFYIHHIHHKTSKDYMGVCVEALRSPSGTDAWHSKEQYHFAPKAIEGFIHSKNFGQVSRITHIF